MNDVLTIARRFRATVLGGKGEMGDKPPDHQPFSPFSPFSPASMRVESPRSSLSGAEPWNPRVALGLMSDADALVERLGVNGTHPKIAAAAAMVTSAFETRDLETVRFEVAEFTATVREVSDLARRNGGA